MLSEENILKIQKYYPFLIPRNVFNDDIIVGEKPYLLGFIDGWERLFLLFCKNLRPHLIEGKVLDSFRFYQIKEKYGRMEKYNSGYPGSVYDSGLDYIYTYLGTRICSRCGEPVKYFTHGYVEYVCKKCGKFLKKKVGARISRISRRMKIKSTIATATGIYYKKYNLRPYYKEYMKCKKMSDDEFVEYLLKEC